MFETIKKKKPDAHYYILLKGSIGYSKKSPYPGSEHYVYFT